MSLENKCKDAKHQDSNSEESQGNYPLVVTNHNLVPTLNRSVSFLNGVIPGLAGLSFGYGAIEREEEQNQFYKGIIARSIALGLAFGIMAPMAALSIDVLVALYCGEND